MKLTDSLREELVQWLAANGIDAKRVPHNALMTYSDGQLTTDLYVLDEQGARVLDPGCEDELLRTSETFPVSTPPPAVAWWLRQRCPTCGR